MKKVFLYMLLIVGVSSCNKEEIEPWDHLKVTFTGPNEDKEGRLVRIFPYEVSLMEDKTKWRIITGGRTNEEGIYFSEPLNPGNYVTIISSLPDITIGLDTISFQINAGKVKEIIFFDNP